MLSYIHFVLCIHFSTAVAVLNAADQILGTGARGTPSVGGLRRTLRR